jgi:hypothetical protein
MMTVSQLSKSFAGRALLDDVSLQVNRVDRIGLPRNNSILAASCEEAGQIKRFLIRQRIFDDMTANEHTPVSRGVDRESFPLDVRSSNSQLRKY